METMKQKDDMELTNEELLKLINLFDSLVLEEFELGLGDIGELREEVDRVIEEEDSILTIPADMTKSGVIEGENLMTNNTHNNSLKNVLSENSLVNFKKERCFNFHISGQANRDGGGYIHNIGTSRPTNNPANPDSYWSRYQAGTPYARKDAIEGGTMHWVELNDGQIVIACVFPHIKFAVLEYSQHIFNRRGNIAGLAFYNRQ